MCDTFSIYPSVQNLLLFMHNYCTCKWIDSILRAAVGAEPNLVLRISFYNIQRNAIPTRPTPNYNSDGRCSTWLHALDEIPAPMGMKLVAAMHASWSGPVIKSLAYVDRS